MPKPQIWPSPAALLVGSGYEAAAQAHFLASDAWCGKLDHANLGPPLLYNTWDTTTGITDDLSLNPPVYIREAISMLLRDLDWDWN